MCTGSPQTSAGWDGELASPWVNVFRMDLNHLVEGFISWSQTPLGVAIVAPLVVASILGLFVAARRFVKSIPERFERWLKRRVGLL